MASAEQNPDEFINVELHCHSDISFDGHFSPEHLAETIWRAGIGHCALTDHDTVAGQDRFREALAARGVECLTGVEISVSYLDPTFHLLAYGFDLGNKALLKTIDGIRRAGQLSRLWHSVIPRRPGILKCFGSSQANRKTSNGLWRDAGVLIDQVHQAGGVVFLAHPLSWRDLEQLDHDLGRLKKIGLDGIEALYKPYGKRAVQKLVQLAEKHRLLVCGGSDYHGFNVVRRSDPALDDSPFHYASVAMEPQEPGVKMSSRHWQAFIKASNDHTPYMKL